MFQSLSLSLATVVMPPVPHVLDGMLRNVVDGAKVVLALDREGTVAVLVCELEVVIHLPRLREGVVDCDGLFVVSHVGLDVSLAVSVSIRELGGVELAELLEEVISSCVGVGSQLASESSLTGARKATDDVESFQLVRFIHVSIIPKLATVVNWRTASGVLPYLALDRSLGKTQSSTHHQSL